MKYTINIVDPDGWMITVAKDHNLQRAIAHAELWLMEWSKSDDVVQILERTGMGYHIACTVKRKVQNEHQSSAGTGKKTRRKSDRG